MAPWPAFEDGPNLPPSLFLQVGFSIIQLRFLIGISKMLGLIVAPIQYVQPHMRRYSPDLRVVRAIVRFCAPQGCSADLQNDRWPPRGVETCYCAADEPRPAPSAVASDHSLRHSGAAAPEAGRASVGSRASEGDRRFEPGLLQRRVRRTPTCRRGDSHQAPRAEIARPSASSCDLKQTASCRTLRGLPPLGNSKFEEGSGLSLKKFFDLCQQLVEIVCFRRDVSDAATTL